MAEFDKRHGISRARFFLQKAVDCEAGQRDEFEAYLDAAIIFARTALLRLKPTYEHHPNWQPWWSNLLVDATTKPSVDFLQCERNWILHEAPARINRVIHVGQTLARASDSYYYETSARSPTDTVQKHIDVMENIVRDAERRFI